MVFMKIILDSCLVIHSVVYNEQTANNIFSKKTKRNIDPDCAKVNLFW